MESRARGFELLQGNQKLVGNPLPYFAADASAHALCPPSPEPAGVEAQQLYNQSGAAPYRLRSSQQIAGFFEGLELVEPGVWDGIVGACQRAGFSPRIEQEAIQMQTIVSLVAAGMGVALVPASLRHLRRTGVAYRPLADRSPQVEIGVAWRRADDAPAVRAFVALARESAAKRGAPRGRR